MKHLRILATLAAVTFAVPAAPLAAQQAPDQLFTSYLAAAGSIATPVAVPSSPSERVSADRESDDGLVPGSMMASTSNSRLYMLGGVALTAGTMYALQHGRSGATTLSSTALAPVATAPSTLPGISSAPGISPPILASNSDVTVNPEPATILLMVTGLVGLGAVARRRRHTT